MSTTLGNGINFIQMEYLTQALLMEHAKETFDPEVFSRFGFKEIPDKPVACEVVALSPLLTVLRINPDFIRYCLYERWPENPVFVPGSTAEMAHRFICNKMLRDAFPPAEKEA